MSLFVADATFLGAHIERLCEELAEEQALVMAVRILPSNRLPLRFGIAVRDIARRSVGNETQIIRMSGACTSLRNDGMSEHMCRVSDVGRTQAGCLTVSRKPERNTDTFCPLLPLMYRQRPPT